MATFGTPFTGKADASNALRCAQAMMAAVDRWNGRTQNGRRASDPRQFWFALRAGRAGRHRADLSRICGDRFDRERRSRLEALTRALDCALVASDDLVKRAKTELGSADAAFRPLMAQAPQTIRGLEQPNCRRARGSYRSRSWRIFTSIMSTINGSTIGLNISVDLNQSNSQRQAGRHPTA